MPLGGAWVSSSLRSGGGRGTLSRCTQTTQKKTAGSPGTAFTPPGDQLRPWLPGSVRYGGWTWDVGTSVPPWTIARTHRCQVFALLDSARLSWERQRGPGAPRLGAGAAAGRRTARGRQIPARGPRWSDGRPSSSGPQVPRDVSLTWSPRRQPQPRKQDISRQGQPISRSTE